MRCVKCPNNKDLKSKRITKRYTAGGLEHVILVGVEHSRCDQCGEEYFGYGNIEQLHRVITGILIRKPTLTGSEVRFLRTRLGYSSAMFAEKLHLRKETISRYENDRMPIPPLYQVMIKGLAASQLPDRDYDMHDAILESKGAPFSEIRLQPRGGEWMLKKAA